MKRVTTVIIGAGHCGLAMSKHLAERSIDHVIFERGEVANSWRTERWDSLNLLTPNWQSRLPGYSYSGSDRDGYMNMHQVVDYIGSYAAHISAPVETHTNVVSVNADRGGFVVATDRGLWSARKVVIASGACNIPTVPKMALELPRGIESMTPMHYRNPDQLARGGVMIVGASATGVQLAKEIQASGRQVTICVGEHVRAPRVYRGHDIQFWMEATGLNSVHYRDVDDIDRARRLPSFQLAGTADRSDFDLNSLREAGVRIAGRLVGISDHKVRFSGSLANQCALADLKMNRLLDMIDDWIATNRLESSYDQPHRPAATELDAMPRLDLNLQDERINTVIWATGYRPDYSWLHVPVLDRKGNIRHRGGVSAHPGLYVMGLPFMRRRKSSLIDGAGDDARHLANHMLSSLYLAAA